MSNVPTLAFNDGTSIPQLGFGVWRVPNDEAARTVGTAIKAGYRSIDTAAIYGNEEGVGDAIAASAVPRDQLYITTKLWNGAQGYDRALKTFDESMQRLRIDVLDLYLIHWPCPKQDLYIDSWKAFAKLKADGRVRSIGVSNFKPAHLERLIGETGFVPVLNQVELHPRFQQKDLRTFHAKHKIATEAWSPLGQGKVLEIPLLAKLAAKYSRSVAQVILRWHIQNGVIAIPKSSTPSRIAENFAVFDFQLSAEDMAKIDSLDDAGGRIGSDPDNVNP